MGMGISSGCPAHTSHDIELFKAPGIVVRNY